MTNTETKIHAAAIRAFLAGRPINSLMELETSFGGPSCGAAGGIVKKWPEELYVGPYVLTYRRTGKRSEIHVRHA